MLTLELFRPQQRVEQIDQHDQRHYESDDIFDFHDYLLQTIAAADIRACNYKKHHGDEDKYNVKHLIAPKAEFCQRPSATLVPVVPIAKSLVFPRKANYPLAAICKKGVVDICKLQAAVSGGPWAIAGTARNFAAFSNRQWAN